MSCATRSSLAVFVFGALDADERERVARHLEGCPSCRRELAEMAPLPALLASVPVTDAERLAPPPAPRRRRRTGIALAIVLLVLLGAGVDLAQDAPVATVSGWDRASGVRMAAQIVDTPPGARFAMRLDGVPAGERCRLVARAADGRSEVVARWQATYAGAASVGATTSIAADELSELSVVTEDGKRLLRIPIRSTE